jgi:hypothetical protein
MSDARELAGSTVLVTGGGGSFVHDAARFGVDGVTDRSQPDMRFLVGA